MGGTSIVDDLSLVHPLSDRVRANAFLSKQRSVVRYSPSPLRRAVIVAGDVVALAIVLRAIALEMLHLRWRVLHLPERLSCR